MLQATLHGYKKTTCINEATKPHHRIKECINSLYPKSTFSFLFSKKDTTKRHNVIHTRYTTDPLYFSKF